MLALHARICRPAPLRLAKTAHVRCEKCGICSKACPMQTAEIAREQGRKAFHDDCTLCGRCVEFCPDDGVLVLKLGLIPLFTSSRDYYKRQVRLETPDGTPKAARAKPAARTADA